MNTKLVGVIFFVSICIFLIGIITKLNAPLVIWDYTCYSTAEDWSKGINSPWLLDHPPGYPIFLTIAFKIFGASIPVARLANALCVLLTTFTIYLLAVRLSGHESGLWASILYLLSPVSIQGSTLMDVADTSLLPLGFIALLWSIVHTCQSDNNLLNIITIGFITAICFWLKVTSTLILLISLFLYLLVYYKKLNRYWLKALLGSSIGIGIFIITWTAVSVALWGKESWLVVLMAPWNGLKIKAVQAITFTKLVYTIRIMFWFSPFFIILFLWKIWSIWRVRNGESLKRLVLLCAIALFYFLICLIGGTAYGFPRYHAAILPLMTLIVGILIKPAISNLKKSEIVIFLGILAVLVVMCTLFFEDPLLFFNLKFKKILLDKGNIVPDAIRHSLQALIFCCIVGFGVLLFKKIKLTQKIILAMLIGVLGSNICLDLLQAKANYITSYEYGSEGKQKVIKSILGFIKEGDVVLATPDLLYELRNKKVPYIGWSIWQSPEKILNAIRTLNPKIVILGLTTHTFKQWEDISNHSEIQLILNQQYKTNYIGTYTVWFKKK